MTLIMYRNVAIASRL